MMPKLLDPSDPRAPKYWMHETSGVLAPVIRSFLNAKPLDIREISIIRAYLKQWIDSPVWAGGLDAEPILEALRNSAREIKTGGDIERWLRDALAVGIDPL